MSATSSAAPTLNGRLVTDFATLRGVSTEWGRLWERNPHREIFSKFSWIDSWWRAYGGNERLLSPAVYEGVTCVGILPLYADGRVLRFIGDPAADYSDLICEPERALSVLLTAVAALDEHRSWDACCFENVPETSVILRAYKAAGADLRGRSELRESASCPTVSLGDDRTDTLQRILGKATVTRRIRQLQKLGTLTFRHLDNRDEAREHLPSLFEQHVRCRALAGIRSQLADKPGRDFFAALVENLDPASDLRFAVLALDGRPIAYNFGFELDGKYSYYTPTYDVDSFDLSPGDVMLRHLFLYVQANGLREFDFGVGDESYKSRYATHTNRNFELTLYSQTARGRVAHAAHVSKERLRLNQALFRAAKRSASALQSYAVRVTAVAKRDGLGRAAWKTAHRIVRSTIYSRDEVLILSSENQELATRSDALTFRTATLSDLTDAAAKYSDYPGADALHALRERIKKGHTPFVALEHGDIVHVVWLRVEDRVATSELGENFVFEIGRRVGLMYDAWTPLEARGRGIYPATIQLLSRHIRELGLEPWIYVESTNLASRRGLEKAGMKVRHRMIRYRLFHRLQRCVVR